MTFSLTLRKKGTLKLPKHYMIALTASIEASKVIMDVYKTDFAAIQKEDGSPVTKADMDASKIINEYLRETQIPILGEEDEAESFEVRSKWQENWCVDPLDGTKMFLKRNDEFCVNIAHIVNGSPVFGIIASPTNEEIVFGGMDYGIYIVPFASINNQSDWKAIHPRTELNNPIRVTCSRSYTHGSGFKFMQILESIFGEFIYLRKGSAMKFFELATGAADVYPCFAPTMEWDIAAGQAIMEALGGSVVSVAHNEPLKYNKESLFNPSFIVKTKGIIVS